MRSTDHKVPVKRTGSKVPTRNAKIARVWCLARDLGLDREILYVSVESITGKDSISKLSMRELENVIRTLEARLDQQQRIRRRESRKNHGVVSLPTIQQRDLVDDLMNRITPILRINDPEAYLQAICKRTFRREYTKLTGHQVQSLIEALKSILQRSQGGNDGSVAETDKSEQLSRECEGGS